MPATDNSDFASLLRHYRRRSGLTQEELAGRAGLSVASISLLERGVTHAPQRATLSLLSEALTLAPEEAARFFEKARRSRHPDDVASSDDLNRQEGLDGHDRRDALPIPLTSLIGREREQETLQALLERETTRLLTLTGPAGVGKTRLALALAAALRQRDEDVTFVDLIPIREPERVLPAIALALDIQADGGLPLRETLTRALRDRPLILALDNFEQVLPAARVVLELLIACPRVRALVTSRSALNVRGEQCFPVAPLPLPDTAQLQSLAELQAVPTVALFVERAQAVWPGFALTTLADGALVADICARLDGLPLAIELAAARIRHVGLRQLHQGLMEPSFLGMLGEGAQDLPDHQRAMRSAITWSYDLLSDEEKRLFRWMGVFIGGASDDAIAAVIGASDETGETLPDQLASLVDASLIQRVDAGGAGRYTQLVTLRAYARERLRSAGEWEEAQRRHANYFRDIVERTMPDTVDQPQEVMARLELEYENIRAALAWAWETGQTLAGLRLAGALRRFWASHSQYLEGLDWLDRFIGRAGEPGNREELAALADAWTGVLMLTHRLDRLERARKAGETALALRRKLGDQREIAYAMMNLANPLTALHDYERARALYEECLALHRATGNRGDQIFALMNLGGLYYELGQPEEALAYYEESLAISREVGESDWARALTWNNVGEAYLLLDEPTRAIEVTEPNYHLFAREHDLYGAATCAFTLGRAYGWASDEETGRAYLEEAERLFRALGNPMMAARIRYFHATFALLTGHIAAARHDLAQALSDLAGQPRAGEYLWWLAERAGTLARCCGEAEEAALLYGAGVSHRDALAGPLEPVEREVRAADLAWLQMALDETVLAHALEEGRTLSAVEAVATLTRMLRDGEAGN